MAASLTTQLSNVQAAIEAIETGAQSFSLGDKNVNRGNLADLYKREASLLKRIARNGRGPRIRGITPV